MKILLTLPDKLTKDIDEVCDAQGYDRVEWIRMAIRGRLYDKDHMHDEHGIVKENNKELEKEYEEYGTIPPENKPAITSTVPTKIPGVVRADKLKVDPAIGFCELHYDTKGPHKRTMCTWDDENGTPLVEKKWICDDCITKYENMGRGHLYYL